MERTIISKRCPHCGKPLARSDNPEYVYQCFECDEDFYEFEAIDAGKIRKISTDDFRQEVREILAPSVGTDYAFYLVNDDDFIYEVKTDVEQTSAWGDEGYYNDDDIRLAIGRTFLNRFNGLG